MSDDGKPIIPEYLPPGVRNVDPDPLGRSGGEPAATRFNKPARSDPPPPPYNDALAPPGARLCSSCGGAAGGCAACWCPGCGAPPGYVRAGCSSCAGREGEADTTRSSGGRRRRRRLGGGKAATPPRCWRCGTHGPWLRLTAGPAAGGRFCESCGANVDEPGQRPELGQVVAGVCRVCGCTDDNACPPGCWWADHDHTLCSSCADTVDRALVAAAGEVGRQLGGPVVGMVAQLVAGLALGEATESRRTAPKAVKAAMSSRKTGKGPRR